jgi:hypothetical protein
MSDRRSSPALQVRQERIGLYVIAHGIPAGITTDADEARYVTLFRLVD